MNPSNQKIRTNKWISYIKKNLTTIILGLLVLILLVFPDSKSFLLRQLSKTGLFNAKMELTDPNQIIQNNLDFDFINEFGERINTSSLRGKVVFINFWASWCPPCKAEFPSIQKLYDTFKDNPNLYFLIVNEDEDKEKAKTYLAKEGFTVPFFQSVGYVPNEIFMGVLPTTVVLDKNGKIRFQHKGFANYASSKFIQQINDLVSE